MSKKNLLISEPPLQVLPSLAKAISLNEAIVLQQLHYWIVNPKAGVERDGFKWIFNTYEEWQENFPFWSIHTIQRTFTNLEHRGLIISAQLDKGNYDRRKYYRINYEIVETLEIPSKPPKEDVRSPQNGIIEDAKVAHSLNESETTTEKEQEISSKDKSKSQKLGDPVDGTLFYMGEAKEKQIKEIENVLLDLERLLHRNIQRAGAWQDLAKWMLKRVDKENYTAWAQWYMADVFRSTNSWRLTPEQVRACWPQAFVKAHEITLEMYYPPPPPDREFTPVSPEKWEQLHKLLKKP